MLRLRRLWWGLGYLGIAIVITLQLIPHPPTIPGDDNGWAAHVLAYGTMMAWFACLLPAWRVRLPVALAFCALGIAMEYAQRETGYRTFDVGDMLADAVGVTVGWLLSPPRVPDGVALLDRFLARFVRASPESPP